MHALHILVVEDDEFLRRWLRRLFQDIGFVYLAADAKEARVALREFQFDAILSDHDLPGEKGLSLLEFASTAAPGARRVLFSADPPLEAELARRGGTVTAILEKPARGETVRTVTMGAALATALSPA